MYFVKYFVNKSSSIPFMSKSFFSKNDAFQKFFSCKKHLYTGVRVALYNNDVLIEEFVSER